MRRVKEVEKRYVAELCFKPDLTLTFEAAETPPGSFGFDERAVTAILSGTIVVKRNGGKELVLKSVPGERTYRKMDALPEYRFIYESRVERCVVEKNGTLVLEFNRGTLKVLPFDEVEAWEMYNDKGFRMICMPGGDVAVWSEDSLPLSPGGDGESS